MKIKALIAALMVAFTPLAASAVVIDPDVMAGEMSSNSATVPGGTSGAIDTWTYVAFEPVTIFFSLSGTGMADDLAKLTFNGTSFSSITTQPMGPATAGGFLLPVTLAMGDSFDIDVAATSALGAATSFTVAYSAITAIPLPAAGWMFVSALAGLGFVSRKRRAA